MSRRAPALAAMVRRLWAPVLVLVGHAALVVGFDAYVVYPNVDIVTHLAGGAAAAFLFAGGIAAWHRGSDRPVTTATRLTDALLVLALTCTVAVLWEFGEYVWDQTLGTGLQRGLTDTLKDLAMGMSGGAGYLAFGSEP